MIRSDGFSEVDGWMHALTYVGGISGFHLKNGNQRELIKSIVAEIQKVLPAERLLDEGEYIRSMTEGIILNLREGSDTRLSTEAFELISELRILLINSAIFESLLFADLRSSPSPRVQFFVLDANAGGSAK
ncbi:hypothetical protein EJ110_NYTH55837 [Nymphaea thermarum]|nr:hypothetical protein EJ110_NYTH55837 [Nymphaea thermarum]